MYFDSDLKYNFIQKISSQQFVDAIYLFGSRAQNYAQPRSDIDLCIVCPKASEKEWQKILDIVEDADTLLQIDCLRYDKIKDPQLLRNIDQNHKVLFQR